MNLSRYRKAIAAVVVPVLVLLGAHYGFHLDAEGVSALTAIITGAVVYGVRNES